MIKSEKEIYATIKSRIYKAIIRSIMIYIEKPDTNKIGNKMSITNRDD